MLNINRRNFLLPRYIVSISVLSYLTAFGLITGCKKQNTQNQTDGQDGTSNYLSIAAPARNSTPLSDVDRSALQTLLIQHPTVYDADAQVAAAKLLGEHRRIEVVPILIERIDTIHSTGPGNIQNPQASYPAVAALVQIGEPAVQQIMSGFEAASNQIDAHLLVQALVEIKGKSWVISYLGRLQARKITSKVDLARLSRWVSSFPAEYDR